MVYFIKNFFPLECLLCYSEHKMVGEESDRLVVTGERFSNRKGLHCVCRASPEKQLIERVHLSVYT